MQQKHARATSPFDWSKGSPSWALQDDTQPKWQYWLRQLNPAEIGRVAGERLYDLYERSDLFED